jgi:hypothetical protein
MPSREINDALDGMTAKQLESLIEQAQRRLAACAICSNDGAFPCRVTTKAGSAHTIVFSLLLCPACIEKHRLPEGRSA